MKHDQFTCQSTATPLEKARRMLQALADKGDGTYFYDDGYPRGTIHTDAAAALAVLNELAAATAAQPRTPDDLLRQSEREGWRYASELEARIKELEGGAATVAQPTQQHLLDIAWATIAGQKKELDRLRLEMSETGHLGHAAVEAECVHMALDERRVPREEAGQSLSLWGRVLAFAGAQEAQP